MVRGVRERNAERWTLRVGKGGNTDNLGRKAREGKLRVGRQGKE